MIEQHARVTAVDGDLIELHTEAQTGCHACGAKSGCGSGLIAQMFPARFNQRLRLGGSHLRVAPRPGDQVVIGIDERYLQKSSLLLYAVPLLGLIAGAILGQSLWGTELASILGGLLGLSTTLVLNHWGAAWLLRQAPNAVRILRVETPPAVAVQLHFNKQQ
jgi:sigma-E factor negative regulatory protein RseC